MLFHIGLRDKCQNYLSQNVSPDNCLKLRAYAKRYGLHGLLGKVGEVIANNFVEVLRQDDFKDLDMETLTTVIDKRKGKVSGKSKTFSVVY